MTAVVCFDTNIVMWGIRKEANEEQIENISRSELLIRECRVNDTKIIIPSVVLAEILAGLPVARYRQFYSEISRLTIIVPFDTKAAFKFGELKEAKWKHREEIGVNRHKMKFDMQIVATAITNNASCIYSEDNGLMAIANNFIEVRKLPKYTRQTQLEI